MPPHVQPQAPLTLIPSAGEVTEGWWLYSSSEKTTNLLSSRRMWSPFFLFARLLFVRCSEALVSFLSLSDSEQKRRLKAEKKAAEKEAKVKEQQQEQKDCNDKDLQNAGGDEETLDPNVRFFFSDNFHAQFRILQYLAQYQDQFAKYKMNGGGKCVHFISLI